MGRTKPFNTRKSKGFKASRIIVVHNPSHPWKRRLMAHPKFRSLSNPPGKVVWIEAPVKIKDAKGEANNDYYAFLKKMKKALEGTRGVRPSDWTVCLAFNHGARSGKVTFDPRGGAGPRYNPKAPDWWTAPSWFPLLFAYGARRLHFHTCSIGTCLKHLTSQTPTTPHGGTMKVTGWDCALEEYVDEDRLVCSDDYFLEGMPLCSTMRGRKKRPFNALVEIWVDAEGAKVNQFTCARQR